MEIDVTYLFAKPKAQDVSEDQDLTQEEDLFPESLTPLPLARIVCVVCEKPATVDVGTEGRICDLCRPQAAQHVAARHAAAVRALEEAWGVWDVTLAESPDQARWARVEAARGSPRFEEAWAAALAAGGSFADLLAAREALEAVSDASLRVFEWAERVRREM